MSFQKSPDSISGIPLGSLTAIVLDTETTGLDTSKDRIIEIGAVRLENGSVAEADTFQSLVNPGIAIPPTSTAIHHIEDSDIADAPDFSDAMSKFAAWAGPAVVLGYSVGFDLAVLKAEHERSRMTWQPPRSLDIRHLVRQVAPSLPDQSLETVAAWMKIEVTDRHRALGDAVLTARIFAALVPMLRQRGIHTFAQAERASLDDRTMVEQETMAGWLEPRLPGTTPAGVAEYARIDSYPYRYRVADLMTAPPITVSGETRLSDAMSRMLQNRVSALFVEPIGETGEFGIVTEHDIMRAVIAEKADALEMPVERFARRPLITIGGDEFVYRALTRMRAGGFRHLGVHNDSGKLTGALSMRDLLRQRADDAVSLGDSIQGAASAPDLGRIWPDLTNVARELVREDVDSRDIAAVISREVRALTSRAADIAESELDAAGKGRPPAPYTLLVLGSAGRGESLLAMDQDNAIIHDPVDDAGAAWFAALGKRVADILDETGVAYCKGGIMASNPAWRMDLESWRETVRSWIARSRPEDILNCDIFFDALAVHGDTDLAETVRNEALEVAGKARTFLNLLAVNARDYEDATGWFGRLKLKDGRIDLKMTGLMPIFSTARVAALRHGIKARSTPDRLRAACESGTVSDRTVGNLIDAHGIILDQILRQQLRDLSAGIKLSNAVAPNDLDGAELQQLKWALEQVPLVVDVLGTPLLG